MLTRDSIRWPRLSQKERASHVAPVRRVCRRVWRGGSILRSPASAAPPCPTASRIPPLLESAGRAGRLRRLPPVMAVPHATEGGAGPGEGGAVLRRRRGAAVRHCEAGAGQLEGHRPRSSTQCILCPGALYSLLSRSPPPFFPPSLPPSLTFALSLSPFCVFLPLSRPLPLLVCSPTLSPSFRACMPAAARALPSIFVPVFPGIAPCSFRSRRVRATAGALDSATASIPRLCCLSGAQISHHSVNFEAAESE